VINVDTNGNDSSAIQLVAEFARLQAIDRIANARGSIVLHMPHVATHNRQGVPLHGALDFGDAACVGG